MEGFILLLSFFTRIPVPYVEYTEEKYKKGIKYLPIVGLIIGIILFIFTFLEKFIHRPVLSLMIWIIYIWITGAIHLDGFSDTIDGIFSNRDKEKMLEIMKDSRIGAFGVIGIIILLISNITLTSYIGLKYILLVPIVSRTLAIFSASISDYARESGMGKIFMDHVNTKESSLAFAFLAIITVVFFGVKTIVPIVICILVSLYLTRYITKKIGGMTGDTIGFIIEITQIIFLFSIYILRSWI